MFNRFKAAWFAFLSPQTYWEGVSIQKIADEITLKGGMAILKPDPQTGYIVEVLTYRMQSAIEHNRFNF